MSYSRAASGFLCVLSLSLVTAQVNTGSSALEQRIGRVQDRILPPVLIEGEPAQANKLADRMAALRVPGVSIAVIHDGRIEWARGFGVAKIGGAPVTPETLFQAASISKPVTALAVLRLVQSGKLNLDTDVNQYLKTWKVPENEFTSKNKVTLRGLLTHTAGITVHGFPGYASGEQLPAVVQVLNGQKPANTPAIFVETVPGTKWNYSGGGYVIAQQLLEDVTGKPFPKLMQESVLGPIRMTHSTYEQPLPAARIAEAATPYRRQGRPVPGGPHTYPEMAPAGLWTTPSDLAQYAIAVQKALAGTSNGILSAATTRQMLTPGLNKWGLGPETGGGSGHPYFTHGGSNDGFQSELVAYHDGDGAVIMTNGDNGAQLASEILRTIAYEYKWPDFQPAVHSISKVDPAVLDAYPGAYRLAPNAVVTVTREGNQLYAQLTGQPKQEAFPKREREFFLKAVDVEITFVAAAQGKTTKLILHQNGAERIAKRLDDTEAKQLSDAQAAAARRFQAQKQDSRTDPALRRLIGELWRGEPDYTQMTPAFADVIRQQLPQLPFVTRQLGAFQSMSFKGVGPAGADIYDVKFEKGVAEFRIMLAADGKVETMGFQPQ